MPLDRNPIEQMIVDVGAEAFQRLARLFETETRATVAGMRRLLELQDWRELGRLAHSLKHSTVSFGLADLAFVATELERAADAANAVAAAALITQLEQMIEAELSALDIVLQGFKPGRTNA